MIGVPTLSKVKNLKIIYNWLPRSQEGRFSQPDHVVLQYLLLKNVSGPAQFKLVLFKGQLWCGYALAAALFPKCAVGQRPVS